MSTGERTVLQLVVNEIRQEAEGILSIELVDGAGGELPAFSAGAHVHVYVADGTTRQYSLCNDPGERHRYCIAVLREPESRGGSVWLHEQIRQGDRLGVAGPENHFPLATRGVKQHLMFAGGIGVTPMMAMMDTLDRLGQSYQLYYCTRSRPGTAFLDRLADRLGDGRVILHHDEGDPSRSLDIAQTVGQYRVGTHLYACGPAGFMQAVNDAVAGWPPHVVHQEYFSARELSEEEKSWDAVPFSVELRRSGMTLEVAAGQSVADAMQQAGVPVMTDCEDGYCGTCLTRYLEGDPVHRDSVLDEAGRAKYVMVCCARSRSKTLVLDT